MNRGQRICAIIAAIFIAIALLGFHPPGEPGVTLRDFEAYYAAGATWLAHGDPYSLSIWNVEAHIPGVVASRHEVLPFVGAPATLPLWSLFARLPYHVATVLWTILLFCALVTVFIATGRLLYLSYGHAVLTVVLALAFVPITSDFGLGQAALAAYGFAVFALTTPPSLATVAVALSVLQPNVAFGLVAMFESQRATLALIGGAIVIYVVGALADGTQWPVTYLRTLAAHAQAERFAAIQYTPTAVLYGFGIPPSVAQVVGTAVAVVIFVVGVFGAIRADTLAHRFAILCCAVPFVAGFFHEHDFVVLFVPVILALSHARNTTVTVVATFLVGINWLDFAQQPQALPQDVILAAALLIAAIGFQPQRNYVVAGLVLAAITILGAWIGNTHPLSIWPNDMHGVARGATIAQVWKNEQLQTGLLRPDAAAAALRSFALLGSALLFYVVLNIDVHEVIKRRNGVGVEVL